MKKKIFYRAKDNRVDAGYNDEKLAFEVKKVINTDIQVIKRNKKHAFIVLTKKDEL